MVAGVLVADPFLRRGVFGRKKRGPSPKERRQSALLSVGELDFDFGTGKVLEEDYRAWRVRQLAEAARWLRDETQEQGDLGSAIEAEVARIRAGAAGGRFHPSCDRPQLRGDRF